MILELQNQAADTPDDLPWTRPEVEAQVQRIIRSPQFRNAFVLQSFLRFITARTMVGDLSSITEHGIATEVFARGSAFDSSVDTIVRTQAYRLRLRLRDYYNAEGKFDPILIEVPKGHYLPLFTRNSQTESTAAHPEAVKPVQKVGAGWTSRWTKLQYKKLAGIVLSAFMIFGLGVLAANIISQPKHDTNGQQTWDDLDSFWSSFIESDRQPIIAFANSVFLATETGDMLRFQNGPFSARGAPVNAQLARQGMVNHALLKASGPTYFNNDMTGIGEVAGVVTVIKALERVGAQATFKRSQQISAYDLSNHNVIFLGSPFVNPVLNDLPKLQNFLFTPAPARSFLWAASITNAHPQAGEAGLYRIERAPGTQILRADYAVVSLLPGLLPNRKILILAGLTTSGTQAAAQFITSLQAVKEIRWRFSKGETPKVRSWPVSFECLLRIKLHGGLDIVQSECLASRFSKKGQRAQ